MWKISQLLLLGVVTAVARFDSRTRSHMWVEFVVVVLQGFFLQVPQVFLPPPKDHTFKFQFQAVEVKSHLILVDFH